MSTLQLEQEPAASGVSVCGDRLVVDLADGRTLSIPLGWYPRLQHATDAERGHWRLLGDGYAIEWPDIDEHIGIGGLLAGRASGESDASLKRGLASR